MKTLKNIYNINFIKCLLIILISFVVSACTYETQEKTNLTNINALESHYFISSDPVEITREEFVQVYATNNNISFEKADAFLKQQTTNALLEIPNYEKIENKENHITWKQKYWEFPFFPYNTNFKAKLILYYEVWEFDTFRQINYATVGSKYLDGNYNGSWVQINGAVRAVNDNNTSGEFPTQKLTLMASGYFEANVPNTNGTNFDIPGFSVKYISEETIYFISETFLMQHPYNIS